MPVVGNARKRVGNVDRPKRTGKGNGRAASAPPPTESIIEKVGSDADCQAYVRVLQDQRAKRTPKRADLRAARRYEQAKELRIGLAFVGAVPRRLLAAWAGVQNVQIDKAADRYGLPVKGPSWSVAARGETSFRACSPFSRGESDRKV